MLYWQKKWGKVVGTEEAKWKSQVWGHEKQAEKSVIAAGAPSASRMGSKIPHSLLSANRYRTLQQSRWSSDSIHAEAHHPIATMCFVSERGRGNGPEVQSWGCLCGNWGTPEKNWLRCCRTKLMPVWCYIQKFVGFLKDKEIMHWTSFAKKSIQMFKKDTKLFLADPTVKIWCWQEQWSHNSLISNHGWLWTPLLCISGCIQKWQEILLRWSFCHILSWSWN